ncbi:GTPase [Flavobacterium sp.]
METQSKDLNKVIEKFKNDLDDFNNAKVKCGIIGRSGTGKSSLINAIVGEEVSAVGEIETTSEIGKAIEHNGLLFFDLPGSSTTNFPIDTYVEKLGIKDFDCVILVTSDRFYEDDLTLINEITKIKIPLFAVRTKLDFSVERALKRNICEQETIKTIFEDLNKNLLGYKVNGIYLLSADFPAKYDLNKLIDDISNSLNKIKRQRFIADVNITSKAMLDEKRILSEKLISKYAALSSLNAINPVPGLDLSVDLSLLYKMSLDIQNIYGLSKEQMNYQSHLLKEDNSKLLIAKAVQFASRYVGKEALLILLKRAGISLAGKEISKWVPFVGTAVAALIGFKLTSSIGNDMLNAAEEIATETFEVLKSL